MDLTEIPIGATFSFDPKSEASINEQIRTRYSWHTDIEKLMMAPGSKFRLLSPPQNEGNFRLEALGSSIQPALTGLPKLMGMKVREVETPKAINELPDRNPFSTSCDPELFLENGKGEIIPAFEVLPDAENKIEVDNPGDFASTQRGAFYADGFGAEFSPAPYACHAVVNHRMAGIIKRILKHVRTTHAEASISPKNFVEIPAEIMAKGTDAQVALGCQPSENIYGTPNFAPPNSRAFPYRMVGGHIHLGDKLIAPWLHRRAEPIIRAMDAFCGVPTVAMFDGIDDPRRRQYYGRAGEFRFQPHGLEYRALSNAWLSHPMFSHLVMNLARASFRLGFLNWADVHKVDAMRVQYIIDNYDVKEARKFVEEYKPLIRFLLKKDAGEAYPTDEAFRLFEVGVQTALPNWDDFEGNWSKHKSVGREENGEEGAVSTWRFGAKRVLFKTKEELKALEVPAMPWATAPAMDNQRFLQNIAGGVLGGLAGMQQQEDNPQLAAMAQAQQNWQGAAQVINLFGQNVAEVPQADENAPVQVMRWAQNLRLDNMMENAEQRRNRIAAEREAAMRQHQANIRDLETAAVDEWFGDDGQAVPAPNRRTRPLAAAVARERRERTVAVAATAVRRARANGAA